MLIRTLMLMFLSRKYTRTRNQLPFTQFRRNTRLMWKGRVSGFYLWMLECFFNKYWCRKIVIRTTFSIYRTCFQSFENVKKFHRLTDKVRRKQSVSGSQKQRLWKIHTRERQQTLRNQILKTCLCFTLKHIFNIHFNVLLA